MAYSLKMSISFAGLQMLMILKIIRRKKEINMFEWLVEKGVEVSGKWGEIKEYSPETKKFIIEYVDDGILEEVNIFNTEAIHNIDWFENWQKNLTTGLIRNEGKITIYVLSTSSGDNWSLEIYRHKTLLPTPEYQEQVILTNYVIVVCGEVKGNVFARQSKRYSGCAIDEEKEFSKWIEGQIEKVSEFNNTEHWQVPCSTIVFSDCLCTKEESDLLHEMFNDVRG